MGLTTIRGGRQITDGTIPYVDIQNVATNTILGNNTAGATTIQEVALASSTLLGRGATGNITAVTVGSGITFSGTIVVLATAFGDTVNPYGSKTANTVLAAPNGSAGVPTFRALVAADIPVLSYEPTITAGTTVQYWRGDKSWQTLNTAAVPESGNLYYTDARARAALSFTAGSGAYNSSTGVITIPINTNQLTNGSNFITAAQTYFIGTTSNAINRSSAAQTLTGVSIDGTAGSTPVLTASGSLTTQQGSGTVIYSYALSSSTTGLFAASDNANSILTVNRHPGDYYSQFGFSSNGNLYYRNFGATAINTSQAWQTIWTSSNDGAGSGLDADLLDGYGSSVSSTADTIALRNNAGDISVRELIITASTIHTATPSSLVGIYPSTDQAVKFADTAVRTFLNVPTRTGGDASGTWGINVTGYSGRVLSTSISNVNTGRIAGTLEYYDVNGATGQPASGWHSYISVRHGNDSNQYGFQFANGFGNETLYWRGWDGGSPLAWRTVWHSGNLTNLNQLTNGPGYITGSYLPTSGGYGNGNYEFASDNNTATDYSTAAVELRETNRGSGTGYLAPRLSFHWGNVTASQISIETTGRIVIRDNPGTGYEAFAAAAITAHGNLTVGAGATNSYIYMTDTDETTRAIHCNSNRIGFLNSSNTWAAWCDNTGNWNLNYDIYTTSIYATNWFRAKGDTGFYFEDKGYGVTSTGAQGFSYGNISTYGSGPNGWNGYGITNSTHKTLFMMDSNGSHGFYDQPATLWTVFWNKGNSSLGLGSDTTSSSYKVYVAGTLYATGDVIAYSDRRKKTDIVTIDNALEKVNSLRGVYYTKIGEEERGRQLGVIAQEVNDVVPEAVSYADDLDEYGVKYGNMVGMLIEAIKEQQTQIIDLKKQIEYLAENR